MSVSLFFSPTIPPKVSISSRRRRSSVARTRILSSSEPHHFAPNPLSSISKQQLPSQSTILQSGFTPCLPLWGLSSNAWCPRFPHPPPASILRPLLLSLSAFAPLLFSACGGALAATATDSIRASRIGLRIAETLRRTGLPDGAIVFSLAALPVLELRGAIPVGYWMQLHPSVLTVLSITGNMVPVPLILIYLRRLETFLSKENGSNSAAKFLDVLLRRAREKAELVREFQWLGLMLFVAVPFPGTGAWTGAIVASVLDMPFWTAISANFFGVVFAGLLVNLLVNLGLKYAVATGVMLFILSTFMWSGLRFVRNR